MMEKEDVFIIREKDHKKAPRGSGACYDIQVMIGDVPAAFTYNIPEESKEALIAKTWNDKSAYFLGIITPPKDGSIYLVNCKCVMDKFVNKKYWEKEWLEQKQEWYTCYRGKCSSICCEKCFDEDKVKKVDGYYKCPFPCKTGITSNECNDIKKKTMKLKKIETDTRECAECGMTRKKFNALNPFCQPMAFTAIPDNSGK
jgi:hypothetical protein